MEIVFISSDRDIQSFNEYFGKMPWISLPEDDKQTQAKLSKTFEVNGIPHLLVLDARTGHFVTHNAKGEVANVAGDAEKGNALIRSWKAMESVPVNDAVFAEKKFSIRYDPILPPFMYVHVCVYNRDIARLCTHHSQSHHHHLASSSQIFFNVHVFNKYYLSRTVVAFVLKHPMFIVALIYFRPFEKLKNKLGL